MSEKGTKYVKSEDFQTLIPAAYVSIMLLSKEEERQSLLKEWRDKYGLRDFPDRAKLAGVELTSTSNFTMYVREAKGLKQEISRIFPLPEAVDKIRFPVDFHLRALHNAIANSIDADKDGFDCIYREKEVFDSPLKEQTEDGFSDVPELMERLTFEFSIDKETSFVDIRLNYVSPEAYSYKTWRMKKGTRLVE